MIKALYLLCFVWLKALHSMVHCASLPENLFTEIQKATKALYDNRTPTSTNFAEYFDDQIGRYNYSLFYKRLSNLQLMRIINQFETSCVPPHDLFPIITNVMVNFVIMRNRLLSIMEGEDAGKYPFVMEIFKLFLDPAYRLGGIPQVEIPIEGDLDSPAKVLAIVQSLRHKSDLPPLFHASQAYEGSLPMRRLEFSTMITNWYAYESIVVNAMEFYRGAFTELLSLDYAIMGSSARITSYNNLPPSMIVPYRGHLTFHLLYGLSYEEISLLCIDARHLSFRLLYFETFANENGRHELLVDRLGQVYREHGRFTEENIEVVSCLTPQSQADARYSGAIALWAMKRYILGKTINSDVLSRVDWEFERNVILAELFSGKLYNDND